MTLTERWIIWRNRLLASPTFQRRASAFPLTRPVARRHASALFDLVAGFAYSQILRACVELELLILLAAKPRSSEDVAETCSLPFESASTLLKAAAALDLAQALPDGRFALGQAGAALLATPGLMTMIRHHDTLYADLADPVSLLRKPKTGTLANYWSYASGNQDAAARYSALMSATQPMIAQQVLSAYNFSAHRQLLDIGGGEGAFVAAIGARYPGLRLSLFDLPEVVNRACSPGITANGGNFRTDPLPEGADCISLVRILHDHDDSVVTALLAKVRAPLPAGGRIVIAEPMAGTSGAQAMGHAYFGMYLLAMGSGRPRTVEEYRALLSATGFGSIKETPTPLPLVCRVIIATN